MNAPNSTMKMGGVVNTPLQIFQPMNLIVWITFFSPIILATSITSLSFIFQNFKGLIYLGFLLACAIIRNYAYWYGGGEPAGNDGTVCTSIQYSKYGNPTFSAFVFAFTIMYLSLPMFSNGAPNFWVFISLIVYFFVLNVLFGLAAGALIVTMMYAGGSGKHLFFNEVSSNKEICYQPKEQTFKCQVYKDGTLVGSI